MPRNTVLNGVKWAPGTLAAPDTAAYQRVKNVDFASGEARDFIPGAVAAGIAQPLPERRGARFAKGKFTSELRGQAGSITTTTNAIIEAALFRAAGMVESIVSTHFQKLTLSNNTHLVADSGPTDPIDLFFNVDGLQQKLLNGVCECELVFEAGQIPVANWEFTGNLDSAAATATTDSITETAIGTFTPGPNPLAWVNAGATFMGVSGLEIMRFGLKFGNKIFMAKDGNAAYGYAAPQIVSREPEINILFRVPALSSINPGTMLAAATESTFSIPYLAGGASHNTLTLAGDCVITGGYPGRQDQGGQLYYAVKARTIGTGNLPSITVSTT